MTRAPDDRCDCCGSYRHAVDACPEWWPDDSVPASEVPELFPSDVSDVIGNL